MGTLPDWLAYVAIAAVFLGLFGLLFALVPRARGSLTAADRVVDYTTATGKAPAPAASSRAPEVSEVAAVAKDVAADLLKRNQGLEQKIAARLEAAGSQLKPAEWLLVHTGTALAVTLVGLLLGRGNIVLGLVFLALGIVMPWIWLGLRVGRRRKAFDRALPDTLQLISGSLAAGLSLQQSVDVVTRDGIEPVAGEFRRVLVETRLGVSVDDAMENVAVRFNSKDFHWVVMAIRIQRQVGGNLAELLDTVAATMREREYVRRQVNALAAEGKLSALVLALLPPLFLLYVSLTNWSYVNVLFTDPRGLVMLIGGALWLALGVFWMSRLIRVEL
ncbi:MAG: type II secretion system F family protein [Nocardioides sp.]|uniref:type II secretion system F family protein n=1 Tax=Nocardioides sp. TaxID=35761 RepID=UPI0039E2D333